MFDLLKAFGEILGPEGGSLAHRGRLGGLEVGPSQGGEILPGLCENTEAIHDPGKLVGDQLDCVALDQDVCIADHVLAGCPQMDDAGRFRGGVPEGVDMGHDVVSQATFVLGGLFEVDVLGVGPHGIELLIGDGEAQFLLAFRQSDPDLSPELEFSLGGKDPPHFSGGVSGLQRGLVTLEIGLLVRNWTSFQYLHGIMEP